MTSDTRFMISSDSAHWTLMEGRVCESERNNEKKKREEMEGAERKRVRK